MEHGQTVDIWTKQAFPYLSVILENIAESDMIQFKFDTFGINSRAFTTKMTIENRFPNIV